MTSMWDRDEKPVPGATPATAARLLAAGMVYTGRGLCSVCGEPGGWCTRDLRHLCRQHAAELLPKEQSDA